MKNIKRMTAWLLAVVMLMTSVDYVHAAEEVQDSLEYMVSESDVLEFGDAGDTSSDGNDVSGGNVLYSGEEAGIIWSITSDGLLTIGGEYDAESGVEITCPWLNYKAEIKKAVVTAKKVESTSSWFRECTNLVDVDVSGLDTGKVTGMSYMFYGCSSLSSLDLSSWDTSSVTNMYRMFAGCKKLVDLNMDGWDTGNVTKTPSMFSGCRSLTSLDLSGWDTSSVTKMYQMFYGCSSLSSLDLTGWDMGSVTDVGSMFYGCSSLGSLDLSNWNTSSVTDMSYMFYDCSSLSSLDLSGWDIGSVTSRLDMFDGCSSLSSLDLSDWDTSSITDMSWMFSDFSSLKSLDLSGWDTSSVTDMYKMFEDCSSLVSLDLSGWDTGSVTDMSDMFLGCSSLTSLDLSGWDTGSVTSMSYMFCSCSSLTSLDLSDWDTGSVTDMSLMFDDCSSLSSLDLSGWDTGSVTDMSLMFASCSSLGSLNLSGWDTGSVTDMSLMFYCCSSLGSLDLSDWDTGSVTDTTYMFYGCSSLGSLDMSGWDTGSVTSMSDMFYGCSSLGSLDLNGWDTGSVTSMSDMFYGCSNLSSLDLSGWDTGSVTSMTHMLYGCSSLSSLDLSGWNMGSIKYYISYMLVGCDALIELKCMPGLEWDIRLPHKMQDEDGNEYTYMPKNLTEGLWLYAQGISSGDVSGIEWTLLDNGTLVITGEYDGTAMEGTELPWHAYADDIKTAIIKAKNVESTAYWFDGCNYLNKVVLNDFDTSKVTNMTAMFRNCTQLERLDVSGLDMGKVANAEEMFGGCSGLKDVKVFKNLMITIALPHHMLDTRDGQYKECEAFPLNIQEDLQLTRGQYYGTVDGLRWYVLDGDKVLYITGEKTNMQLPDESISYPWTEYAACYTKVIVDAKGVLSTARWFKDCTSIKAVDLSGFDAASLVETTDMLSGCTGLEMVKTAPNLTVSMEFPIVMFDGNATPYTENPLNLEESIEVYKKETSGEIQGLGWFLENGMLVICGTDTSTTVSTSTTWPWHDYYDEIKKVRIHAKNVKSTAYWFNGFSNLTEVDFSEFDTSTVENMSGMFLNCESLEKLDLSKFHMDKVTDANRMFEGCVKLKKIHAPLHMKVEAELPGVMLDEKGNVYRNLPMGLTESVLLDVELVVKSGRYYGMAWAVLADGTLLIMGAYSEACDNDTSWHDYAEQIQRVKVTATGVTSTKDWFKGLSNLENLDFSGFDTFHVTDMSGMFNGCSKITKLDLSNWNVAKVASADDMFDGCTALVEVKVFQNLAASIKLPHAMYDLQAVEYLQFPCNEQGEKVLYRFPHCGNHKGITWIIHEGTLILNGDGSDAIEVKDWQWLKYAEQIQKVVVYTKNVKTTACWFDGCKNLTQIDWSGFDFINVMDMSYMFRDCTALTTLDISGWNLSKVMECKGMLNGCIGMQQICMPAKLAIDIEVPKTMYNYLGEPQTTVFPKYQPETEWYYAISPVGDGELHVSKVYPYTYTGKAIKPEIRVYDGATLLIEKKDYTISYKNNTKAAAYNTVNDKGKSLAPTIVVKGKGNYTKTETVTFDILAKDIAAEDVVVQELAAVAGKKVQLPVPKITYNGKKLVKNKDFTVNYPDLDDSSKVDAYKVAGIYRVVITGKGNFTGTRELLFVITNGTLMSKVKVGKISAQEYTGSAIEPVVSVTYKKAELVVGKDYLITYKNNTEIGKASIVLTGMGDYAGTKTVTFQIAGQSIAKAAVSGISDKMYNGQAQTQQINVELAGKKLEAGKDYTVSYSKNVNAGTASVTVTGKGAYSGSVKKSFKITSYDLESNSMQLFSGMPKDLVVAYEKGGSMPLVNLSFDGVLMNAKKDYIISYSNNKAVAGSTDAKAPTITIKGKGNFKGSVSVKFTITARNLQDTENPVSIRVPDMAYSAKSGKWLSKPVLTDSNGKKLVAGTDYEKDIIYTLEDGTVLDKKSVVEAGQVVKVKVIGKGCYIGIMETTYKIAPAPFKSAKIKVEPKVYTGKGVTLAKEDITVALEGKTLTYGVDYEIVEGSYKNNLKKGTASVTIKGLGNYGGEKTVKFKIVPKEFIWFWRLFS